MYRHIAAFVDLLGQRKALERFKLFPDMERNRDGSHYLLIIQRKIEPSPFTPHYDLPAVGNLRVNAGIRPK
jgi:hypothetical protein